MSLYIRLQSSFWSNRKTLRLRAAIGDAAFWVPPRLWSYAADNQPDGDFSDYSDSELAMLIGYQADAQALLQALHACVFLENRRIHDWQEHNGYHTTFSDRARKAAEARWKKERTKEKEMTGKDKKGKERSKHCLSMLEASNGAIPSLPTSKKISFPNGLTDSEWLAQLVADPTYTGIDVMREHGKMANWCKTNSKTPTRRRFINWLNRADKPLAGARTSSSTTTTKYERLTRTPTDQELKNASEIAKREIENLRKHLKHQ